MSLSPAEEETVRGARLAVFEQRLILQTQPPIEQRVLNELTARFGAALPADLVALWRTSFGGTLAYDLRLDFEGRDTSFSWTELFYPDSDDYHDLWGWIEHEEGLAREAAEERGERWTGRLIVLPFGGFEYLDRVYAQVATGAHHGSVVAWMQGLPPAWTSYLDHDAVTRVAESVRGAFRLLNLEADPTQDSDSTGARMLDALEGLEKCGAHGRSAAEKLRAMVLSTVLDWRSALRDGTLAGLRPLRRLAMEHAARTDDAALLIELAALGCDLSEMLRGGCNALDHALGAGALGAARLLLDRGVPAHPMAAGCA